MHTVWLRDNFRTWFPLELRHNELKLSNLCHDGLTTFVFCSNIDLKHLGPHRDGLKLTHWSYKWNGLQKAISLSSHNRIWVVSWHFVSSLFLSFLFGLSNLQPTCLFGLILFKWRINIKGYACQNWHTAAPMQPQETISTTLGNILGELCAILG